MCRPSIPLVAMFSGSLTSLCQPSNIFLKIISSKGTVKVIGRGRGEKELYKAVNIL